MLTEAELMAAETQEEIFERMMGRVPDKYDKNEGNIFWDCFAPASHELYRQRAYFREMVEQKHIATAQDEYLDRIAADYNLDRLQAKKSTVQLEFSGQSGSTIPAGTIAAVPATEIMFVTLADAVIGDTGNTVVSAECAQAGVIGLVQPHLITLVTVYVAGVRGVDNPAAATGGYDRESDDSLRNRIKEVRENTERGGHPSDYEKWGYSVTGVGWCKALNFARGLGTVDLVISGAAQQLPDLVQKVQVVVDSKKPGGIDAKVRMVRIRHATFQLHISNIEAETARLAALTYLRSLGVGAVVRLSHLVAAVVYAGTESSNDIQIISPLQNISLEADEVLDPIVEVV